MKRLPTLPSRNQVAVVALLLSTATGARAQVAAPSAAPPPPATSQPDEQLSDEAELARIVGLVGAARYEECAARLGKLLDPTGARPLRDPNAIETARIYHATCLLGLDRPDLADEPLRAAIRKNPQMRAPDSLVFPQKVVDRFLKVREDLYAELREAQREEIDKARREAREKQQQESEAWAKMLLYERLAREEVVVTKNRRWIALVPFGVGQFQNGETELGWVVFGAEAALGIAALTSLGVYSHLQTKVEALLARGQKPEPSVRDRVQNWRLATTLSAYGFLGIAAAGIAQAQIAFVPEVRQVRERKLPPLKGSRALELKPELFVGSEGMSLGVSGRF
jgi:hypothetical protein